MASFVLRRTLQAIVVLFAVTLGAFLLIHVAPGDPARIILGFRATPEALASLRRDLGLDKPLPQQYLDFVAGAFRFDFGDSIILRTPISTILPSRIGATALLTLYSTIVSLLIAVPLGIVSALRRNRFADHSIRFVTMVGFAMPSFWLGLLLILIFSVHLGWFPSSGYPDSFFGRVEALTLPAITLGVGIAPLVLRTLRSSMIETMSTEFVETARARGLRSRRVLLKYILRNSLVASVTVLGVNVGILLGGVVVVENVFVIPGLGSLLVNAVLFRDFPLVSALTLIFGFAVVLVNALTDITYAKLDPRVRL